MSRLKNIVFLSLIIIMSFSYFNAYTQDTTTTVVFKEDFNDWPVGLLNRSTLAELNPIYGVFSDYDCFVVDDGLGNRFLRLWFRAYTSPSYPIGPWINLRFPLDSVYTDLYISTKKRYQSDFDWGYSDGSGGGKSGMNFAGGHPVNVPYWVNPNDEAGWWGGNLYKNGNYQEFFYTKATADYPSGGCQISDGDNVWNIPEGESYCFPGGSQWGTLSKGVWERLGQRIKINEIGQANGFVESIDGTTVTQTRSGLTWATTIRDGIQFMYGNEFAGGSGINYYAPKDQYVDIDDITVYYYPQGNSHYSATAHSTGTKLYVPDNVSNVGITTAISDPFNGYAFTEDAGTLQSHPQVSWFLTSEATGTQTVSVSGASHIYFQFQDFWPNTSSTPSYRSSVKIYSGTGGGKTLVYTFDHTNLPGTGIKTINASSATIEFYTGRNYNESNPSNGFILNYTSDGSGSGTNPTYPTSTQLYAKQYGSSVIPEEPEEPTTSNPDYTLSDTLAKVNFVSTSSFNVTGWTNFTQNNTTPQSIGNGMTLTPPNLTGASTGPTNTVFPANASQAYWYLSSTSDSGNVTFTIADGTDTCLVALLSARVDNGSNGYTYGRINNGPWQTVKSVTNTDSLMKFLVYPSDFPLTLEIKKDPYDFGRVNLIVLYEAHIISETIPEIPIDTISPCDTINFATRQDSLHGSELQTVNGLQTIGYMDGYEGGNPDWFRIPNLDFDSCLVNSVSMQLIAHPDYLFEFYMNIDSVNGRTILTWTPESTGDWTTWSWQNFLLDDTITGLHDIYIVIENGENVVAGGNFINMVFLQESFKNTSDTLHSYDYSELYNSQGLTFDQLKYNECDTSVLLAKSVQSYLLYKNFNFDTIQNKALIKYYHNFPSGYLISYSFEIRIDNPTSGQVIGTLTHSGSLPGCYQKSIDITYGITGIHDIYIVAKTNNSIFSWLYFYYQEPTSIKYYKGTIQGFKIPIGNGNQYKINGLPVKVFGDNTLPITASLADTIEIYHDQTASITGILTGNYDSLAYSTSLTGIFNNNKNLNTIYSPSIYDIGLGSGYIKLSAWKNGIEAADSVYLKINYRLPTIHYLADVADGSNITTAIEDTAASASDGDVIVLPKGLFVVDQVDINDKLLSIIGYGDDSTGTFIYENGTIFDLYNSSANLDEFVYISGIYTYGNPSAYYGGSTNSDQGTSYIIHGWDSVIFSDLRMRYNGYSGIEVHHPDSITGFAGLVFNSEILDQYKTELANYGYGISVYGTSYMGGFGESWISDPEFGSEKFFFSEDNYYRFCRHSYAGGGGGKYVGRKDTIINNWKGQPVDLHGKAGSNNISTRAAEVYDDYIYNVIAYATEDTITPSTNLYSYAPTGVSLRGGEALVHDNEFWNYRRGTTLLVDNPSPSAYPDESQTGYLSGVEYGDSHTGNAGNRGNGDYFEWNNTWNHTYGESTPYYVQWTEFYNVDDPTYLIVGRDYHSDTIPSGYTEYEYPHPARNYYKSFAGAFMDQITGLTEVSTTTTTINISWTDVLMEDGYYIYVDGILNGTNAMNDTTYTITGLSSGQNVSIYVKAYNDERQGKPTSTLSSTTD